jgi:hypothetical protein
MDPYYWQHGSGILIFFTKMKILLHNNKKVERQLPQRHHHHTRVGNVRGCQFDGLTGW